MRQGFTLIELMIVIAIIAIIAAIAIPNLLESRITANESSAAASLKSGFSAAQTQFKAGTYCDLDADGAGEYANEHAWLAGSNSGTQANGVTYVAPSIAVPGTPSTGAGIGQNNSGRALGLLGPTFNTSEGSTVGSYKFRIDNSAVFDTESTPDGNADFSFNEGFYVVYAAPSTPGSDGRRSFSIGVAGTVVATRASVTDANLELSKLGGSTATTKMWAAGTATGSGGTSPTECVTDIGTDAAPYAK